MDAVMDIATVTSKGQITIPKAVRSALGIRKGSRLVVTAEPDGSMRMRNATLQAFEDLRAAFEGAAEEAGLETEESVAEMIREFRAGGAGA